MLFCVSYLPRWYVFRYEKNLQGDIVAVYNDTGTKLVTYYYDAFGYCIVGYDNNGSSTRAYYNPFRYRGYYYDKDLDLYYLNARYYDRKTGRFISPDAPSYLGANGDLNSYNLYAYCSNNPVMYADPEGNAIISAVIVNAIIGAVIGGISNIAAQAISGQQINWAEVGISAASGAVTSVVTSAFPGMSAVTTGIIHGFVGAGTYAAVELVNGNTPTLEGVLTAGIINGVMAAGTKAFSNLTSPKTLPSIGHPFSGVGTSQVGVDPNTLQLNPKFTPNPIKYNAALREINTNGMYGVIEVQRNGIVINGQHRVLIARKLQIAVDVVIR